jgi:hypothetical protein
LASATAAQEAAGFDVMARSLAITAPSDVENLGSNLELSSRYVVAMPSVCPRQIHCTSVVNGPARGSICGTSKVMKPAAGDASSQPSILQSEAFSRRGVLPPQTIRFENTTSSHHVLGQEPAKDKATKKPVVKHFVSRSSISRE